MGRLSILTDRCLLSRWQLQRGVEPIFCTPFDQRPRAIRQTDPQTGHGAARCRPPRDAGVDLEPESAGPRPLDDRRHAGVGGPAPSQVDRAAFRGLRVQNVVLEQFDAIDETSLRHIQRDGDQCRRTRIETGIEVNPNLVSGKHDSLALGTANLLPTACGCQACTRRGHCPSGQRLRTDSGTGHGVDCDGPRHLASPEPGLE